MLVSFFYQIYLKCMPINKKESMEIINLHWDSKADLRIIFLQIIPGTPKCVPVCRVHYLVIKGIWK